MNVGPALFDPRLEHLFGLRTPLLKALRAAGDCYTVGDIAHGILTGQFQYWQAGQSALITEIVSYPRKRVLVYFLVLGNLEECLSAQPQVEAFARENGCSAVLCMGRDGWLRVLPKSGWKPLWNVMAKELYP